jgi:hypothetical protein
VSRRLLAIPLALALLACQTVEIPPYPARTIAQYPATQVVQGGGLAVAVEPVLDRERAKKYFASDLLGQGLVAVLVVAENRSTSKSYLVTADSISLVAADTQAHQESSTRGRPSGWTTTPGLTTGIRVAETVAVLTFPASIVLMPLAFGGAKKIADAEAVEYNMVVTGLHATTLSPGEGVHGFAYFQLGDEKTRASAYVVGVELLDLSSREVVRFEFPLVLAAATP